MNWATHYYRGCKSGCTEKGKSKDSKKNNKDKNNQEKKAKDRGGIMPSLNPDLPYIGGERMFVKFDDDKDENEDKKDE